MGFGVSYPTSNIQKLIKRTIFSDHLALLIERQDDLLAQLTQIANEGFSKAKEEWEKNLLLWGTNLPRSPSLSLPLAVTIIFRHSLTLFISRQTPGETTHRSHYGYRYRLRWPNPLKRWMWTATVISPWASAVLLETRREVKMEKRAKIMVNNRRNVTD